MLSQSIEDYLKVIYEIQNTNGKVTTTSLSNKLEIAPASVTGMLKKLSSKKLVTHKKYQGVQLTESGKKIALEVIRHHRLIELYLKEALMTQVCSDISENWVFTLKQILKLIRSNRLTGQ